MSVQARTQVETVDCTSFSNAQDLCKIVLICPMCNICARLYLFPQCAIYAQYCTFFLNVQYMRKICARLYVLLFPMRNICVRLYLFPQCAIYAQNLCVFLSPMRKISARFAEDCTYFPNVQDLHKIKCTSFSSAQHMHKICMRLYFFLQCTVLYFFLQCAIYEHDLCKIVLISSVRNICARFAQDCTSFSNAQYAQDCTSFPDVQYMRKIVLISPMHNICATFARDCTYFSNAQYMCKIVLLSRMCNICTRLQALLGEICHISHLCSKFRVVFTSLLFLDCHKL